jgi:CheY-like chemotaxis protein
MKKILIIEDHPDMLEMLGWEIELMGFIPIMAKLGEEGMAKALNEIPELIILDIMMPHMDGWEVVAQLRTHPEMKDVPIVAATALFRDRDLKKCIAAGCSDYIVKPFTFKELQVKVRKYLPTTSESFAH